jgi:hypothetical protein
VIGFLVVFIIALILFQFKGIILELINVTSSDIVKGHNYIRIQAAKFFLHDFSPNKLAFLTGNGDFNANSAYGQHMIALSKNYNYYLGDLGILLPLVKYGILFVITVLILLIKTVRIKLGEDHLFLKVIIINLLLYFPLGGGYDNPAFIISFLIVLYLIENYAKQENKATEESNINY